MKKERERERGREGEIEEKRKTERIEMLPGEKGWGERPQVGAKQLPRQ